jgi:hypothetical protein
MKSGDLNEVEAECELGKRKLRWWTTGTMGTKKRLTGLTGQLPTTTSGGRRGRVVEEDSGCKSGMNTVDCDCCPRIKDARKQGKVKEK